MGSSEAAEAEERVVVVVRCGGGEVGVVERHSRLGGHPLEARHSIAALLLAVVEEVDGGPPRR